MVQKVRAEIRDQSPLLRQVDADLVRVAGLLTVGCHYFLHNN